VFHAHSRLSSSGFDRTIRRPRRSGQAQRSPISLGLLDDPVKPDDDRVDVDSTQAAWDASSIKAYFGGYIMRLQVTLALGLALAVAANAAAQMPPNEIKIGIGGPLTTPSAGFGVEMRQAVDMAIDERNGAGGLHGARVIGVAIDDRADVETGKGVARSFCNDPAVLGVVGHVNSGVAIATGQVYADCGLAVVTPMASNPKVTESGFATIFRLTNRDDRKGPGLARYLIEKMGKKRALVIDDGTPYGTGLAGQFAAGFSARGTVTGRKSVAAGDQDFADFVGGWPKDFDVVFFAGIREGALILKEMRRQGLTQLFSCGDGCWDANGFIHAAEGAATTGEGVRVLSAAPALGDVPGSAEFAAKYTAKYGPINNYAASSYDAARVLMAAIAEAATRAKGAPARADVVAALRALTFQGIAYAKPVAWTQEGDNKSAVIFVNAVEGDHFRQIDQIGE
jgi:branched-chain amino acid transport system substrate-binding protein